jgi:Family of unknown function (DUF6477)
MLFTGTIMKTVLDQLAALRRPGLLMRAARHGALDYDRSRDLKRLMRRDVTPGPVEALTVVMEMEERAEAARQNADAGYSVARHIDLLVALVGEASLVKRVLQG